MNLSRWIIIAIEIITPQLVSILVQKLVKTDNMGNLKMIIDNAIIIGTCLTITIVIATILYWYFSGIKKDIRKLDQRVEEGIKKLESKDNSLDEYNKTDMLTTATLIQLIREIIIPEIYPENKSFLESLNKYPYFYTEGIKNVFGNDELLLKKLEIIKKKSDNKRDSDELIRLEEIYNKKQGNTEITNSE